MVDERTKEKVRSLLDMASRDDTPEHERALAEEKAQKLIAIHGIELAMLEDATIKREDVTTLSIKVEPSYAREKAMLLATIGTNSGCRFSEVPRVQRWGKGYYGKGKDRRRKRVFSYGQGTDVTLTGFPSDLERVQFLYSLLLSQVLRRMRTSMPEWGEDLGTHRASVIIGFVCGLDDQMREAAARAKADHHEQTSNGRGAELVLADRKSLVDRAFENAHPDIQPGTPVRTSGSGYEDGYEAGRTADVNRGRVGQQSARALS